MSLIASFLAIVFGFVRVLPFACHSLETGDAVG
jgi:hypothetical protein